MNQNELKTALRLKNMEWEAAMEMGKPYKELLQIYKEIKELQYRLLVAQLGEKTSETSIYLPGSLLLSFIAW